VLAQATHDLAQFIVAEKRRGAAAEVQLFYRLLGVEVAGYLLDFLLQAQQIGVRAATVLGDDLVAGAVVANIRAERHVHIQR